MPVKYQNNRLRGYPIEFREEYCVMLVEHMAEGYSFNSFGGVVGISKTTLEKWLKEYEEFAEGREVGKLCQLKKWEELLIMNANGMVSGGGSALKFAMTNYFPEEFKEKSQVDHNGNVIFQIESGIDHEKAKSMEYIDGEFRYVEDKGDSGQALPAPSERKEDAL